MKWLPRQAKGEHPPTCGIWTYPANGGECNFCTCDPYDIVAQAVSLHGPDQLTAYELVEMGMAELVSGAPGTCWFRATTKET